MFKRKHGPIARESYGWVGRDFGYCPIVTAILRGSAALVATLMEAAGFTRTDAGADVDVGVDGNSARVPIIASPSVPPSRLHFLTIHPMVLLNIAAASPSRLGRPCPDVVEAIVARLPKPMEVPQAYDNPLTILRESMFWAAVDGLDGYRKEDPRVAQSYMRMVRLLVSACPDLPRKRAIIDARPERAKHDAPVPSRHAKFGLAKVPEWLKEGSELELVAGMSALVPKEMREARRNACFRVLDMLVVCYTSSTPSHVGV
jgi:hypothetical protein